MYRRLLTMWPLQQLLSDKRQNIHSFSLVRQNRQYQLYWLMCNTLSSVGFGLDIGVHNFIVSDMELMKKFRIGSGLQNFHIRMAYTTEANLWAQICCKMCGGQLGAELRSRYSISGSGSGHLNFFVPAPTSTRFWLRPQNNLVQPIIREKPVATQQPLRNCVGHLAAPSHMYATPRVETGQQQS